MKNQSHNSNKNPLKTLSDDFESTIYTTKSQSEILTSCYFGGDDGNRAFNLLYALDFDGMLDSQAMELAIQTLVDRHESLRATFSTDGIHMSILKKLPLEINTLNLSDIEKKSQINAFENYTNEESFYVFDLVNGPLIRFKLIKFSDLKHSLIMNIHHIICDGWSVGILLEELGKIYSALVENKTPLLKEAIPFSAYAEEEQLFANSNKYKEIEKYWFNLYEQSVPVLNLPTDNPRPPLRTYESEHLDFVLDAQLVASIKKIGLDTGTSLITALLAAFEVFISQITGQNDIVVGVPAAGQPVTGMNCLVGHCVNLLPLRSNPEANISFIDYLNKRKIELFDAYDNQQLSFGHLLQNLNVARDPSRIPLVPVAFSMSLDLTDDVVFSNLNFKLRNTAKSFDTFEIVLNASVSEKNLVLEWSFNKVLFEPETIKKMMMSFQQILQKIIEDPSKTLGEITFQDYTNKNFEISGPKMGYPKSTLHELFADQAEMFPNAIALEFDDKQITYSDLSLMINQMANYLWLQGLRPGQIVAVSLDRTPELSAVLLSILKCGAAYLPLDSKFPITRLEFMLEDSQANFLLTSKSLSASLPFHSNTILIDEILSSLDKYNALPIKVEVSNDAVVYIIYTSGSTGKPKGVTVTHKNLVNFLSSMTVEPGINMNDKLASITTISFDISGLELFLPLIKGATVVFADYETTRDGQLLLNLIKNKGITILQATPTTWQMLLDSGWETPLSLKALCGGEAMPLNLARELTARCDSLWNMYGPTETTIWSAVKQIQEDDELITIGLPIANTQIYLLDEQGQTVEAGAIGEIVIGGDGVAQGYWKRPELTAEKFIPNAFSTEINSILYRTGDLGRLLPTGEILCLGRIDHQVKIRGHRIELGEIEASLNSLPGVKQSAVIISNYLGNEAKLVAYLKSSEQLQDEKVIHNALSKILPEISLPSKYIWVDDFPITPNGKIDKKKLPVPEYKRPDSAPLYKKPGTQLEKNIAKIWSEELQIPIIGIDDDFFDMGGSSVLAQKVTSLMRQRLSIDVPVSKIYTHPTISELSTILGENKNEENKFEFKYTNNEKTSADIAIIGMAVRLPGADTIEELWENLKNGTETISFFSKEELDISLPESLRNDPLYIGARGLLPSAKNFDASFFGLNPQLAAAMDPQIRVFLEIAWEALEQSGHLPKHYKGSIGVYSGSEINTYYENNIFNNKELKSQIGDLQIYTVNGKDFIAPRTSYHLNLKGPSVSVHSACSTSLLAVAEAVKAIRMGMCDIALAGGSSVTAPIYSGHLYDDGFIKSPDGRTRPFEASGKGTVFSDGAGVVLLKRLEEAEKDGDIIYGVLKGVGVNNDGGDKGSFMAPSAKGQAGAIINAFNDAKISPSTISYTEAHGTATPIGDPIEIEGLKIAYGKQEKNGYCALGSIKSNMGHTTAAAGVAGLIKVVLAMRHKKIPPMVGFNTPNPNIDFANSPFFINNKLIDWEANGPRRAGVSSFGIGSTNVHVIVEEYEMKPLPSSTGRPLQILMWSAKNQNSLLGYENALSNFIEKSKDISLADIAYSLNVTREEFNHRSYLIASANNDDAEELISQKTKSTKSYLLKSVPSEIGFLFPGQGAQYLQMGKTLYDNEKVYREAIDKCAELLMEDLKLDIRHIIYPEINNSEAEEHLKNTRFTQPALFVTEYALSQLWMSWGIKPTFLCGHSIGEFTAAHLAGVFTLKDALHIVAVRGQLISELPGGSMLAVRVPVEKVNELLPTTLSLAAINSKQFCVVSGTKENIATFNQELDAQDIPNKILITSHAFHSYMMDPILDSFKNKLEKIKLSIPRLPIISTVSGIWLTDTEATSPMYWVNHLKNTVRFADAMDTAFELEDYVLLEVGPGQTLTTLARQQAVGKIIAAFPSLTIPKDEQENEYSTVLNALGELWLRGIAPDWNSFYNQQQRQKIDLPSYVFDCKPCWIEPISVVETTVVQKSTVSNVPLPLKTDSIGIQTNESKKDSILVKISEIIKNAAGIVYESDAAFNTFLELGLDSLSLTQLSGRLKKEFDLPITFRQLNEGFKTPSLLADYIAINLPEEEPIHLSKENKSVSNHTVESISISNEIPVSSNQNQISLKQVVHQIQLLSQKIDQLQIHLNTTSNGGTSVPSPKTEHLVSTELTVENRIGTNGVLKPKKKYTFMADESPIPGSKLGRDENGNPAWFIEDSYQKGKFVKIKSLEPSEQNN